MTGRKPYLTGIWDDDDQMCGLLSMIKARDVNPNDYDWKVKFWTEMISSSCEAENDPIFSINVLKRRFRRGDQIPGSLDVILNHMLSSGEVMALSDYESRDQTWFHWGCKRVVASILGNAVDTKTEYVHMPTVQNLADRIVEFFRSEYSLDDDMLPEIVDANDFYKECSSFVANRKAFNVAVAELIHRGEVTVGTSRNGDEILKFRDVTTNGPIQWSETDAGVHDMRRAMSKLEHEIKRLEIKAKKADQDARMAIRIGDKTHAAHYLRQKKRAMKEIETKDVQYQRLLDMMHQLGRTKQNKQVLDAYKAGANAFRSTLERQGISPDEVDRTMDSISDALATAEEIEDAIATGVPRSDNLSEDLEAELSSILADDNDRKAVESLPDVPSVPFSEPVAATDPAGSLADRLHRLREAAN